MKEFLRLKLFILLFLAIVFVIFFASYKYKQNEKNNVSLVIYGSNISTNYTPFVDNGSQYISVDTIAKTIDPNIYYDKVTSKIIITTYFDFLKLKTDDKKLLKNLEYVDIKNPAKVVDDEAYLPIDEFKDVYNVDVSYNDLTKTISIDKKNVDMGTQKYNDINVYSDLNTNSNVISKLNKNSKFIVYDDTLTHNRWFKIKTDDGVVGYVSKKTVTLNKTENTNENAVATQSNRLTQKVEMFWQYGSDLNALGTTKTTGVNVVSPTWFETTNSTGNISSNFDQNYYNQAKSLGYKVWPIITNGIDSASYSADDISQMLGSEYNRQELITNILDIVDKYNLDGINIDFENMKTSDRDMFSQFIRELAPMMRQHKKILSVDMYFVSYIDRQSVGDASDYVILMGYDQRGNWSDTAGSIAQLSWVDSNVSSLINDSKIDPNKIILGIPFYTRLWTENKAKQTLTSNIYSMKNCQKYISDNNLTPVLDQDAGQNFVQYTSGNVTYKLWIEDNDSIKKRVEIVNKYGLAGVSGWKKGFELSDTWNVINDNLKK